MYVYKDEVFMKACKEYLSIAFVSSIFINVSSCMYACVIYSLYVTVGRYIHIDKILMEAQKDEQALYHCVSIIISLYGCVLV